MSEPARPPAAARLGRASRAAWRAAALVAITSLCFFTWCAGVPFVLGRPPTAWRWRTWWFGRWARRVLSVLGVAVDARGLPPAPPFLLVCNHLGYLDILVLASRIDAAFVAKAEVARWPVMGVLCRAMGTIFIDRERRRALGGALDAIGAELTRGHGVVLFPEGTSSGGSRVLPFHPPLLAPALRAGLPVAWAALSYRTPPGEVPAAESVCWWGEMSFLPHLWNLLALPRIEATLRLGDEPVFGEDRKQLADRLWQAIAARLETDPVEEACAVSHPDR